MPIQREIVPSGCRANRGATRSPYARHSGSGRNPSPARFLESAGPVLALGGPNRTGVPCVPSETTCQSETSCARSALANGGTWACHESRGRRMTAPYRGVPMRSGPRFRLVAPAFAILGFACSSGRSSSTGGGSTSSGTSNSGVGSGGASSGHAGQGGSSSSVKGGGGQAGSESSSAGKGGASGGQTTSSSSGSGPTCSNLTPSVSPCGGDLVGTWTVQPSCMQIAGEMNATGIGLGCDTVKVTGIVNVSGTLRGASKTTPPRQAKRPSSCPTHV
jgi:hypothetical protein